LNRQLTENVVIQSVKIRNGYVSSANSCLHISLPSVVCADSVGAEALYVFRLCMCALVQSACLCLHVALVARSVVISMWRAFVFVCVCVCVYMCVCVCVKAGEYFELAH